MKEGRNEGRVNTNTDVSLFSPSLLSSLPLFSRSLLSLSSHPLFSPLSLFSPIPPVPLFFSPRWWAPFFINRTGIEGSHWWRNPPPCQGSKRPWENMILDAPVKPPSISKPVVGWNVWWVGWWGVWWVVCSGLYCYKGLNQNVIHQ